MLQYHGSDRNRSPTFIASHDVVITTYQTLVAEPRGGRSGLMAVDWLRVVCDEAHALKNHKSQQAQAAAALKASRRWAVTGTPIQNRLQDLYGLLVYLKEELLSNKDLFSRCLDRPLKARDPRAVKKLQVGTTRCLPGSVHVRVH